jgi:GNAT superfamily N-acetyltransferase
MNAEIQAEFPEQISGPASKKMSELAKSQDEFYWIAVADERVVGTIGVALLNNQRAVLKRMVVAKPWRGTPDGAAAQLFAAALGFVRSRKVKAIFLGTMAQFIGARKFYLKKGFTEIPKSEIPSDYTFNPVDTVFFKLQLL